MQHAVRNAVRFLQVYPLIVTIAFLCDVILDTLNVVVTDIMGVLFGVSMTNIVWMWILARRLKVSLWSRTLYATLFLILIIDLIDLAIPLSLTAVMFDRLMFTILAVGCISSFLTYIYTKYKAHGNI